MDTWWVHQTWSRPGGGAALAAWVFWVIASICLHELGHGIAAIWQGDDTPRRTGHMTLNPVVHMGSLSLLFFAVIGFAWGMMPVNPSRFRWGHLGEAFVAFAGPLVNLLLALFATVLWALWIAFGSRSEPLATNMTNALEVGIYINLFLFVFNLLPIPPLDGSRIAAGLVPAARVFYMNPQVQAYSFFALLGVMFLGADRYFSIWAARGAMELQLVALRIIGVDVTPLMQ
ncbi:MAG: site-2 protease family protein [Planctomycetota bacterium]|nr:site-2 protease family protein [Planctomycetota bacterium]